MELKQYALTDEKIMINMIKDFWKDHNGEDEDDEEARADLIKWSKETSDRLYLFKEDDEVLGFAHLGSRGASIDWLEHLYVKKDHRKKGVVSKAIELLEAIVKEYSISMYIEVAARNLEAMDLYHRLGYDTLNTITIRKDFTGGYKEMTEEKIAEHRFSIKKKAR